MVVHPEKGGGGEMHGEEIHVQSLLTTACQMKIFGSNHDLDLYEERLQIYA
jgi:hypothetical protein